MGTFRGLAFALTPHSLGVMDAYLDGQLLCRIELRDNAGAQAVLNVVERLAGNYGPDQERCKQYRSVSEGQLKDYEARLGSVFKHVECESQLADSRDKLEKSLSGQPAEEGEPSVTELDGQLKALRAANAVESATGRVGSKPKVRADKPVTARIVREEPQAERELVSE